VYHSPLGWRVIKKKKKKMGVEGLGVSGFMVYARGLNLHGGGGFHEGGHF
jgi:hypothetical protein